MSTAKITISHGQSQSFNLEEGANIKLSPSTTGQGVKISVDPNSEWNMPGDASTSGKGLCPAFSGNANEYLNGEGEWSTPPSASLVTTSTDGLCPTLPSSDATSKFLRGDGQWTTVPNTGGGNTPGQVSNSEAGLCPSYPAANIKYILTPLGWKKYKVSEVPVLIFENLDALANGTDITLNITEPTAGKEYKDVNSTKVINNHEYMYLSYQHNDHLEWGKAGIFVLTDWYAENHTNGLPGKIRCGHYGEGQYWADFGSGIVTPDKMVEMCPYPQLFLKPGQNGKLTGEITGWHLHPDSAPYSSYAGLPFAEALGNTTYSASGVFRWITLVSGTYKNCDNTVVFSMPRIELYQ